jgi:hypothetical protein
LVPGAKSASSEASKRSASFKLDAVATSTSEELALLASDVCFPQVTKQSQATAAGLENFLIEHGYKLVSSHTSQQVFGRVVPGFVAAQKETELGQFMIAFGEGLPACAVMLMNNSAIPPVAELRKAFESQGWGWAHMAAKKPDRLPYAGFQRTDESDKTVLAVLRDNPDSDPRVRLGIDISYTTF